MLDHAGPIIDPRLSHDDAHDAMAGFLDLATLPRTLKLFEGKSVYPMGGPLAGRPVTESDFWNQLGKSKLVVIDDVRVPGQKEKRWGDDHYTAMKTVLDKRTGQPLIITSNLSADELAQVFDKRIADRALCGTVVEMKGVSRRWECAAPALPPVVVPAPPPEKLATPEERAELARALAGIGRVPSSSAMPVVNQRANHAFLEAARGEHSS